jgi:hypothetical protein
MFVFKYAETTARKDAEPWTIRQSALYHQVRLSDKRSLYILISPYQQTEAEDMMIEWLRGLSSAALYHHQILRPATMLLSLRLQGWRLYMEHYELEIKQTVSHWRIRYREYR